MTNLSRICKVKFSDFIKNLSESNIKNHHQRKSYCNTDCSDVGMLAVCDSGISSSVTTYIIAPAANERRYGNSGTAIPAKITVSTAPIGSTTPDIIPRKHDLLRDAPPAWSGSEIIAPSGNSVLQYLPQEPMRLQRLFRYYRKLLRQMLHLPPFPPGYCAR